jgi:putative hydrolase of HD superfamily
MIPDAELAQILNFIDAVNALKFEMRYGDSLKDKTKRDSTAAHSWRMTLLAYLIARYFPFLDKEKVLVLGLVHDLPEALVGDVSFDKIYSGSQKQTDKAEKECNAMKQLADMLPKTLGHEIKAVFEDYEKSGSMEAKLV